MKVSAAYLDYRSTNSFSAIATDYVHQDKKLEPFIANWPTAKGIEHAIEQRIQLDVNRPLLVRVLHEQYKGAERFSKVDSNIEALHSNKTFTVCTAHQPNIFTGHLYFIYKIVHAIQLAEELQQLYPAYNFVPVYYMGSEDADLNELGEIVVDEKKYTWRTDQKGAVGRMKVDKALLALINELESQIGVQPYGKDVIKLLRECYQPGITISEATFHLVHQLFGNKGLLVLQPDDASLKEAFSDIIKRELQEGFSRKAVDETIANFPEEYKVQAGGRDINLFYLQDGLRERIERSGNSFSVANTDLMFSDAEMLAELNAHPERFSPNVILRPVFQEMILPNVVFIGGGGELAYWMELKSVFEQCSAPFPVMVLRNSFLFITAAVHNSIRKLGFKNEDVFKKPDELFKEWLLRESVFQLDLKNELHKLTSLYKDIQTVASAIDNTLGNHTEALSVQASKKIAALEKKMLRAEKRKHEATERQIQKIKSALYPSGGLQERVDNYFAYYARYGTDFLEMIYQHSKGIQQQFCILVEENQ